MLSKISEFALFDTTFGACAIAWCETGVTAIQLPEASRTATAGRIKRSGARAASEAPPSEIADVIAGLRRYFDGDEVDFSGVGLDLGGVSDPFRRIYDEARRIRWGETVTYGVLASRVGSPGSARVVGQAMAKNPMPIIIPCHRVLASGDRLGGFSAHGGTVQKERLLVLERVRLPL
jgi:methylated-DNA-[protein]-cysteine S-methyltransferase